MNKRTTYTATGFVLGNMWAGGEGIMQSIAFKADTRDDLIAQVNTALEENKITGSGDFVSVSGAHLLIKTITTIEFEGKDFTNEEFENEIIGENLTEEQTEMLENHYL